MFIIRILTVQQKEFNLYPILAQNDLWSVLYLGTIWEESAHGLNEGLSDTQINELSDENGRILDDKIIKMATHLTC
jgi:hypothetical protein